MKNGGVLQRGEIVSCIIIIREGGKLSTRQLRRRRSIIGGTKVLKKLVMHLSFPTNESSALLSHLAGGNPIIETLS